MNIKEYWPEIRKHFNTSFRTNFHVSFATLSKDSVPNVSPIESLFLNKDQTGFYFEKFPTTIGINAEYKQKVCILGVNRGTWFWLKSLYSARFKTSPGIKLYGTLGKKRKATKDETNRLNKRMKATRGLKGNTLLWGEMLYVRDILFFDAKTLNLGKMTKHIKIN